MEKRILILSASVGMGHVRAAKALEQAFVNSGLGSSVLQADALEYSNQAFRNLYAQGYVDLADKAPEVLGLLYERTGRMWETEHGSAFERFNARPLIKLAERYKPDAVICTHSLPADMISWLLCKKAITTQHAIVVTDFDAHTVWLCHHYSVYFVAIDETRAYLEQLGFEPQRIIVTGIPVDPVFAERKDQTSMRRKFGLAPDRLTILISAGGLGMGPMEAILRSIGNLKQGFQAIAVCGHNQELKQRAERLARDISTANGFVQVVGYTPDMDEYMSASDLIIGKPGGLTASEALTKGLVFLIVNPIPGQEERNADHLVEEGVALRCNNLQTLAYKIERLVDNKVRWQAMKESALRLARPNAAEHIVREVLRLVESDASGAIHPPVHTCGKPRPNTYRTLRV